MLRWGESRELGCKGLDGLNIWSFLFCQKLLNFWGWSNKEVEIFFSQLYFSFYTCTFPWEALDPRLEARFWSGSRKQFYFLSNRFAPLNLLVTHKEKAIMPSSFTHFYLSNLQKNYSKVPRGFEPKIWSIQYRVIYVTVFTTTLPKQSARRHLFITYNHIYDEALANKHTLNWDSEKIRTRQGIEPRASHIRSRTLPLHHTGSQWSQG